MPRHEIAELAYAAGKFGRGGLKLSDKELYQREEYRIQMHALNLGTRFKALKEVISDDSPKSLSTKQTLRF